MTPEQQMEAIKAYPVHVLLGFWDLPLRDLFLENVGLIWTFLPSSGYDDLLSKMANRFRYSGHYFPKLFQEFFLKSPLDFKKCFVVEESQFCILYACHFLSVFLKSEDSESIEVIFRNVDAADRLKLVFHPHLLKDFYNCMLDDRWHMVEVCLREATLSKEDRERLKEAFLGFLKSNDTREIELENPKWKRFFEFLYETDASADEEKKDEKRKLENCCPE
ncbi:hypothetical protein AVEN_226069-1 [Araneus ventricosus]|uniref:Uncharacterized protein n=1 Tax=Araneus ventricosus TaxID=182803 RepID=A0A4Y2XCE4_ARAVE|nr:hypothetical protein AVEN_226069-1 [Araneus ventricosus]